MNYHYTESGLTLENHPNYGELVSIWNVRNLHLAIGRWLIDQPRRLTGAEFRFLRTEMDLSQRLLGQLLGVTDQAIAKWEKARQRPVANTSAERLLRLAYSNNIGASEFASLLDRITKLDAEVAEKELHLEKGAEGGWAKAA